MSKQDWQQSQCPEQGPLRLHGGARRSQAEVAVFHWIVTFCHPKPWVCLAKAIRELAKSSFHQSLARVAKCKDPRALEMGCWKQTLHTWRGRPLRLGRTTLEWCIGLPTVGTVCDQMELTLKLPLEVVSNLLGPLSNGRTVASLPEETLSRRQLEWKCSPMTTLPMRDLKLAMFLHDNLLVNEFISGAVIIVQSPSTLGVLEKPRNWFLAVALGSAKQG